MPGPHRAFLSLMRKRSNIRGYVLRHCPRSALYRAYTTAVAKLGAFRDAHIRVVARYIFVPMGRGKCGPVSTAQGVDCHAKMKCTGTGGTDIMRFLRASRDTTRLACCGTSGSVAGDIVMMKQTKEEVVVVVVEEATAIHGGEDNGSQ